MRPDIAFYAARDDGLCFGHFVNSYAASFNGITRRAMLSALALLVPCAGKPIITDRSARWQSWHVAHETSSRTVAGQITTFLPDGVKVFAV